MTTNTRFLLLAGMAALLTSMPAVAIDFVFNVPLGVTRLDAGFSRVLIRCEVSAVKSGTPTVIGSGVATITPNASNGDLPVTAAEVDVNVNPGEVAATADRYECRLFLEIKRSQGDFAVDCTDQSTSVCEDPAEVVLHCTQERDIWVRNMSKPCRAVVRGTLPHP